MEVSKFKDLLSRGFDIEFNIGDVFYSFTKSSENGTTKFYIGNENYTEHSSFLTIEELLDYKVNNSKISEIVLSTKEEEIYY